MENKKIVKTDNTIVLLNFNDPENPWKDECGNTWTPINNPTLVYDEALHKYVANFTNSNYIKLQNPFTNNIIYNNIEYTEIYTKPITIELLVSINFVDNTEENKNIVLFTNANKKSVESSQISFYHNKYFHIQTPSVDDIIDKNIKLENNIYYHLVFTCSTKLCSYSAGSAYYINGTKHNLSRMSCISSVYSYLSSIILASNLNDNQNIKISYLKIEQDVLYDKNFNYYDVVGFANKSINNNNNTKRNIIWNRKTTAYIMDPNFYNK